MTFSSTAPAHPQATGVAVYPALFKDLGQLSRIITNLLDGERSDEIGVKFFKWTKEDNVGRIGPFLGLFLRNINDLNKNHKTVKNHQKKKNMINLTKKSSFHSLNFR